MFGREFWASLRAEHVLLLAGWLIGGAVFWADTRTSLYQHGQDIAKLQQERRRDDDETARSQRELSGNMADIKARLAALAEAMAEMKGDLRRQGRSP